MQDTVTSNGAVPPLITPGLERHDSDSTDLAERLLVDGLSTSTSSERRKQRRLAAVVNDRSLRELTFALTDEVLRTPDARRAARRFRSIVGQFGVPRSLPMLDRLLLRSGAWAARVLPRGVMPIVRWRLVQESNGVVLAADDPAFHRHVQRRQADGFALNVNVLGESILGDAEAAERMRLLLQRIERDDVHYVSLKISAVVANLDVLAFDHSVAEICARLRVLYRAAGRHTFINLDMEEYRDLSLTLAALRIVLDEDEFAAVDAGVVLQAYLPDSHDACASLCRWATERHARAGGSLKIRVVKGANLAMEQVESEMHGWPQAPFPSKVEVDASFKRLVLAALDMQWASAVRVGLASHNLLDIAWAMTLPAEMRQRIEFEMLEGMAPSHSRSVRSRVGSVLLYAPVVRRDDRPSAISYLARRLDENTSEDNFLRWMFAMRPGSEAWRRQVDAHTQSLAIIDTLDLAPRRADDRFTLGMPTDPSMTSFANAPDTDWTVLSNRNWIEGALASCVVVEPAEVSSAAEVDAIVERAVGAAERWSATSWQDRRALLAAVSDVMEAHRGETIALMATAAVKAVAEADAEVSEAVDAARFAAFSTHSIESAMSGGAHFGAHGVVVIAAPWNFPYAIPTLGICAALAAGNTVILKPAPETRAVAAALVEQIRGGGVPDDVIQLACTPDDEVGRGLICDRRVDMVVLTGAAETAALFRSWRPSIRLVGETSGKNAMVITAAADEDLAIKDLVKSAFGHAGQKCSAASVAIIESSVYDDDRFLARLADAVRSLRVGPSSALPTMVGPLIAPPSDRLQRALTTLEPGEAWLVQPRCVDPATNLWSPGVRIGVQRGSFLHRTECFGPVLAVIRADDLDDAVAIQNDSEYGLTGGIHSLDEREVDHWLERVEVGNAYVNRPITGAIVQRQPFGGWKRSSVGCGAKAGGPWYVESFGAWTGGNDDEEAFANVWTEMLGQVCDPSGLRSERNEWRVRPLPGVRVHIGSGVDAEQQWIVEIAQRVTGVPTGGDRVRVLGNVDDRLLSEWYARGWDVDRSVPVADARVELRRWVREQSVSTTAHRLGRLITPAG